MSLWISVCVKTDEWINLTKTNKSFFFFFFFYFTEVRRVQEYAGKGLKSPFAAFNFSLHFTSCTICLKSNSHRSLLKADITLDPSTAHPRLVISAGGKQVHCGERHQVLSDNPGRFNRVVCVLAHQGFSSGRHYWEVGGTQCRGMDELEWFKA